MSKSTKNSTAKPNGAGEQRQAEQSTPTSANSSEQSSASKRQFRRPRNVKEFAAQANAVATMILNGKIDLDTARAYSAIARTVAQAVTAETARARFLRSQPDLTLETDVFDDDD